MKNKPNFFFDNRGFPNWGEGGPPLGNFSHKIPFFSNRIPYKALFLSSLEQFYLSKSSPSSQTCASEGLDLVILGALLALKGLLQLLIVIGDLLHHFAQHLILS